jgi:hypothetical protein
MTKSTVYPPLWHVIYVFCAGINKLVATENEQSKENEIEENIPYFRNAL